MPDAVTESFDGWDELVSESDVCDLPDAGTVEGIIPLGHDRGVFYYLSRSAGQVFALSPAQHGKTGLMAMASVSHYWQRTRHFDAKTGVRWDQATDELMASCRDIGIYDPARVRGRGAWVDDGRSVLHLGNRLVIDGIQSGLTIPGSRFVYEAAQTLMTGVSEPMPTARAHQLVSICQSLRWECGISGVLLAGFIAIAPVCGGLSWRPSIWITGGTGTGKSYIKDNILAPALAGIALQVQSKTSEAGIRQALGCDARPVLFDEAESEDQQAAYRMQAVLDLVRQSSSDGGAEIVKGATDGRARRYRIRSCFAFSSINAGILHEADATRISVLALRSIEGKPDSAAFQALNERVLHVITPGFAAGLVARSVRLLPTIRANAERFAQAVALHLGSRRTGDQYGALFAGAYSLHSEREISDEDAISYVRKQAWDVVTQSDTETDEYRLISHLTQHRFRIAAGNGQHHEPTIGQAVQAAFGLDERIARDTAREELRRTGIFADTRQGIDGVMVSNTHPALRRIMVDTPWAAGWARSLCRLPGTARSANAESFAFGHVARGVWLPLSTINPGSP